MGSFRQVQSCLNSPAGPLRRKQNLGVMDDATEFSQVLKPYLFFSWFLQVLFIIVKLFRKLPKVLVVMANLQVVPTVKIIKTESNLTNYFVDWVEAVQ